MDNISVDLATLTTIKMYNNAHNHKTYVTYTDPKWTCGGVSAEFIHFSDPKTVVLKMANGDLFSSPLDYVTISVKV